MKYKSLISITALCIALILPANALSQSPDARPRRVAPVEQPIAKSVAYDANESSAARDGDSPTTSTTGAVTLESRVPREGLQFYVEVRKGGLAELARAGNSMAPFLKMLSAGPAKTTSDDFAAFALSNGVALLNAKLALVGYETTGAAAMIEAATPADAEKLKAGLVTLLSRNSTDSKNSNSGNLDVSLQGRFVMAGARATVARLAQSNGAFAIVEDQLFMKTRERFSSDPFFAFIELGSQSLPAEFATGNPAYDASMLSALSMTPYALALGGSLQGDATTIRALMIFNTKQGASSIFEIFGFGSSATLTGQPVAASFASPDAEIFVDCALDWEKLFEGVQSIVERIAASAQPESRLPSGGAQSLDLFAMVEASLGFSIKNDLLPTLGNEVAVSLSGVDGFAASFAQSGSPKAAVRKPVFPRFMLMVALKDPAKFEKLMTRLISKEGAASFSRSAHRNATIFYNKDIAFAVTNNFFMLSGSAMSIRRAMDAHALGNSLAASADYRAAIGTPRRAIVQAYISPNVSNLLYESILSEAAKSNPSFKELARKTAQTSSPVGITITPDSDGLMMELRVPTSLTFMALASLTTGKPASKNPVYSEPANVGIPNPSGPSTRTRAADGRRVPKLTDDDLRTRLP